MKSLSIAAVLACAALSGCVVAPMGHRHYGPRPVVAPAPVVVHPGYGRGYHGYERGDRYDRHDRRDGYDGRGRGWRRDD